MSIDSSHPSEPLDRSRQARFAPLGEAGQRALAASAVTVVGVGALGSVAAELLARSGIGRLRLVDRDVVERSNLHRVALFDVEDAEEARAKAPAAAEHLRRLAPDVVVEPVVADLDGRTAAGLLEQSDLVLDGTDNFEARHVLNEASLESGVPWIHAACLGARATVWPIVPGRGDACFACLVPDVPAVGEVETCESAGVLAPAAHLAASWQVAAALRLLAQGAGVGVDLGGMARALTMDCWSGETASVRAVRDPQCPACSRGERRFLGRRRRGDWVACGREAVQIRPAGWEGGGALERLARRLDDGRPLRQNPYLLRFPAEDCEITVFADGRVLVTGTRDVSRARALVSRQLGG